jgi:hypothetical protein
LLPFIFLLWSSFRRACAKAPLQRIEPPFACVPYAEHLKRRVELTAIPHATIQIEQRFDSDQRARRRHEGLLRLARI